MKCDIVIPVWGQLDFTRECVENLVKTTRYPYRLIIVDNASDNGTAAYLETLRERKGLELMLIRNKENLGFVKAVNQALRVSDAPYVCVMNNDTIPAGDWLGNMVDFAERHPDVGLINPQCDGHGAAPPEEYAKLLESERDRYMEMNQCQGFCMLIRREVIDRIGYLDESFGVGGFDDTDYSMRAHIVGYRCVAIRGAYVYHRQHGTFRESGDREEWVRRNSAIFLRKWGRLPRVAVAVYLGEPLDPASLLDKAALLAYGLAREWAWVHIWVGLRGPKAALGADLDALIEGHGLAPHQNFKVSYFSLSKWAFQWVVFLKMLERLKSRMKTKRFDALITFDGRIAGFLRPFEKVLKTRLLRIPPDEIGDDWQGKARGLIREMGLVHGRNAAAPGDLPVDIVIPVLNKLQMTRDCLESISANTKGPFNLVLIDNGSDAETKRFLEGLRDCSKNITLIRNESNIGWVKAVNQGLASSRSQHAVVMNNDTIVRTPDWLSKLVDVSSMADDIGLVNPTFSIKREDIAGGEPFVEVDFCRGYCVLIKRSVIDKIGLLDEEYGLGYYDDDDYSVRAIRAGFRCVRASGVFVEHLGDSTFSDLFKKEKRDSLHERNKNLFYSKWGRRLRILFVLTGRDGRERLPETLFSLARRQHIVYIWNLSGRLGLKHSNIRETAYPPLTPSALFQLRVFLNKGKSTDKRYNAIFVEGEAMRGSLSRFCPNVYRLDDTVKAVVDSMTEATKREHAAILKGAA